MTYVLQIDQNPDNRQDYDVEVDLKATTEAEAISEANAILNSGNYKPYGTDDDPNEDFEIM